MELLRRNLLPRDICTREAFDNAIAAAAGTGGSTNSVLHLLAMAREAKVPLTIDDFDAISERTPIIADLRPGGHYVALDVDAAGGVGLIAKRMIDGGLITGSTLTPSGRSLKDETADIVETPGQAVVTTVATPFKPTGGIVILRGNLAPDGCGRQGRRATNACCTRAARACSNAKKMRCTRSTGARSSTATSS